MRSAAQLCLALAAGLAAPAAAFAPAARRAAAAAPTRLSLVGPEHLADPLAAAGLASSDPAALSAAASDHLQHLLSSTSTLLADAAAAADDAAKDEGWWNSYLEFMKGALIKVHDVVDEPLKSVGIEKTWGPSIFLFTAGVRSLLIPLSVQQSKSSEYMKALKPYQDQIKKKFKDNQDMMNKATSKLFEDANQNPLAGCGLSLVQLPIFLGLYRAVTRLAKDGAIDEPFLWIPTLQGPVSPPNYRGLEWLTEGWTTIDSIPTPSMGWDTTLRFLAMPLILVLGQKLTMTALTPPVDTEGMSDEEKEQNDRSQLILKFLPLLIGFFSLQVPAGLTIYWFTSNFFTLSQSLVVKQYYKVNPPEFELPDYWDALDDPDAMSAEEKRMAAEAGLASGPKWVDVLDEAQFHYVVDRSPMREGSEAWERAQKGGKLAIPDEMVAWVAAGVAIEAANGSHAEGSAVAMDSEKEGAKATAA